MTGSRGLVYFFSAIYCAVPNLFGIRNQFHGRQFFQGPGSGEDGLGMIQAHYIYMQFISIIITSAPPRIIRH